MTATVNGIEIETLLRWGKPREVETKNGPRVLRKARPDEAFWDLWNTNQGALRSMGVSVSKDLSEQWEACWWQVLDAAEVERRAKSLENSRAVAADIVVPAPEGCAYMPFQLAGIQYGLERAGVYLGDAPGLGKTIQSVGLINARPNVSRVLVVTKASLKTNWHRELTKWLVRPLTVGIADSKCFPSTDVVIINYDICHKFPTKLEFMWDMVILDESHTIKNARARRTKAIVGYRPSRKEAAEGVLPTSGIPARYRLALSGTPVENCISELFTVLNYLCPEKFPSRWKFESQWFHGSNNGFGWQLGAPKDLDKLQKVLRESCLLRRLKSEVLTDLPPKTRIVVNLDAKGMEHVVKAERDMEQKHEKTLIESQADYELAKCKTDDEFKSSIENLRKRNGVAFAEMAKVRHEDALAKLPKVIPELEAEIEERGDGKILVFAHHSDVLAQLHAHFPKSVLITGETKLDERQRCVDKFQADKTCGPLFGSIRAVGEGLTLTAANLVCFVEEDWVPGKITQCEDRAHRIGQKDNVLVKHWVVPGTMDANMAAACVAKQNEADAALDDKPDMDEPQLVRKWKPLATRRQIEIEASVVTVEQADACWQCVAELHRLKACESVEALVCERLAGMVRLDPKFAVLARKLALRHRNLLDARTVKTMGGWQGTEKRQ